MEPPSYNIDLSECPRKRWNKVINDHKKYIKQYPKFIDESLKDEFGAFLCGYVLSTFFYILFIGFVIEIHI